MNAELVRANLEAIRAVAGPAVTIVTATKYVPLEDMALLAEAGVDVVGENRAQDLLAKHAAYGTAFRWHFIGHLQSNKVRVVNGICELGHSLDGTRAANVSHMHSGRFEEKLHDRLREEVIQRLQGMGVDTDLIVWSGAGSRGDFQRREGCVVAE